jgi:ABC-type multidrug transport system fused ATPase/permease subunit
MLGSMKGVKMSGLTGKLSSIITNLRLAEIASARLYRMMLVYVVTLCRHQNPQLLTHSHPVTDRRNFTIAYTPSTFSPVITFAAYAKIADNNGTVLDSTRIFTTLSLIALITEPLTALIHALPEFFTAVACFNRIQKFLLAAPRSDTRQVAQVGAGAVVSVTSRHSDTESDPELQLKHQEAGELEKPPVFGKGDFLQGQAITIRDGRFGWKSGEDEAPLLKDVNLVVPTSQLTVVIGPVGCGKSTLLKAILGETPVAEGSVLLSTKEMGFCDQTPWLTNQTLQANVTGFSKYDANWYASVIRACALDQDLAQLPEGDQSMIGSKGITLSGGQKQRVVSTACLVSLARGGYGN